MNNNTTQPTVFLDSIGRTVIGKIVSETDSILTVENPALVAVQANPQTNQLQLQILPLFFKEFLSDQTQSTTWEFRKCSITRSGTLELNAQFTAQYNQMFAGPQPAQEPNVVKLFDEDDK